MRYGLLPDSVWDWEYPSPPGMGLFVLSRYEIIGYTYPKPDPSTCAGQGKCHGCLCWCDWCGDVKDVCDVEWPHWCDTHKRYPEMPEHLKPNPNQLFLPGFEV